MPDQTMRNQISITRRIKRFRSFRGTTNQINIRCLNAQKKLNFSKAKNCSKLSRRNSRINTNFEAENYVKLQFFDVKSHEKDTKDETIASADDNVVKLLLISVQSEGKKF